MRPLGTPIILHRLPLQRWYVQASLPQPALQGPRGRNGAAIASSQEFQANTSAAPALVLLPQVETSVTDGLACGVEVPAAPRRVRS